MTASEAVESLDELVAQIAKRQEALSQECASVVRQWEGLGRLGAQRDDHAAELLKCVQVKLDALTGFVRTVSAQMLAIRVKPFGE